MARKKIDRERLALFVVCEGEAYSLNDAPSWLNQNNWLRDWNFVGAYSPEEAIAVAKVVDENVNKPRIYSKYLSIEIIRSRILQEDGMSPAEIYATQGNSVDSGKLQFNQGWVKI